MMKKVMKKAEAKKEIKGMKKAADFPQAKPKATAVMKHVMKKGCK